MLALRCTRAGEQAEPHRGPRGWGGAVNCLRQQASPWGAGLGPATGAEGRRLGKSSSGPHSQSSRSDRRAGVACNAGQAGAPSSLSPQCAQEGCVLPHPRAPPCPLSALRSILRGRPLEGSICSSVGRKDPGPRKRSRQGCLRSLSSCPPTPLHFLVSPPPNPCGLREQGQPLQQHSQNNRL